MLDLVLKNGIVVDGTGSPPCRGDVAVQGGAIAALGRLGPVMAAETVDVAGQYVVPGLIDAHTHGDLRLLREPVNLMKLRQGVTCEIVGNCGFSLAPLSAQSGLWREAIVNIIGRDADAARAELGFSGYLDLLDSLPLGQHCAAMIGTGAIRAFVQGMDRGPMSAPQRAQAHAIAAQALEAGAMGLSSGLIYAPDCYSDAQDLLHMVSALRESGRPYVIHMRGEGARLISSVTEAIAIANKAQVPLHISHFKAMGADSWGLLEDAIALVEQARGRGQDITCDCYPYTGGATAMSALLPPWVMEGGAGEAVGRLTDPSTRRRIAREVQARSETWDNVLPGIGWGNVLIAAAAGENWQSAAGKSLLQVAQSCAMEPIDVFLDMLADSRCDVSCVHLSMREQDVETILRLPWAFVASDSIYVPEAAMHPRVCGTFPRVLRWALAGNVLALEEAVKKMTSMPAARFGLAGRGVLKEGCPADITVFSGDIADAATYAAPTAPPKGVARVYVGGRLVMKDGEYCAQEPMGKLLRAGGNL